MLGERNVNFDLNIKLLLNTIVLRFRYVILYKNKLWKHNLINDLREVDQQSSTRN